VTFTVPDQMYGNSWEIVVDTADPLLAAPDRPASVKAGESVDVAAQTVLVLHNLY
jgi:isoamylase